MANEGQDPGFGYEAKLWKKNDPLAEADINHMELGIENAHGTLNKYILGRSTKQHFNINAAQVGYQLYKDGTLDPKTTGNYITSDFIRIYSDYDYKLGYINSGVWTPAADDFENGIYFGYVFFDKEQNVIPEPGTPTRIRSFISNANSGGIIPFASSTETGIKDSITGAKYIRFCVWAPNSDFPTGVPDQLVFSSLNQNITEFEPYYTIKGDYFATTAMHNSLAYDLSKVITKEDSPNLLNVDNEVLTNGALEQSGTTINNADSYRTTEFIPVEPNTVYACKKFTNRWSNSSTIAQYYALYSESGNMNSILTNGRQQVTSGYDTITIGNYTAPVYIRFSFKTSFIGSNIAFAKNTEFNSDGALSSYRPYGAKYIFTKDLATAAQLLSDDIPDNATFIATEEELRSAIEDGVTPLVLTSNITLTPDPSDNNITRPLIINKDIDIYGKYYEINCNQQGDTPVTPSISIENCVVKMRDLTIRNGKGFVIKIGASAAEHANTIGGLLIANNCHFWRGQQVIGLAGYSVGVFIDCDIHTTSGTSMNTTASYDVINVHDYSKVYVQRCKIHEGYDEGISTHDNTYAEIYNSEVYNCGYAISYNNTYKATDYKGAVSSYGGIHIGGTGMGIVKGNYSHDNATYGIGIYSLSVSTNHYGASQCIGNVVKHNGFVDIDPHTGGVTDPTPNTRTHQVGVNSGGIIVSGAKNCEIRSNLILDNVGYGIRVGVDNTGSHYSDDRGSAGIISDNKMFGNLVYLNPQSPNTSISGNTPQIDPGYNDGLYINQNIFDILKTKAEINGFYPDLTAGSIVISTGDFDETIYSARPTYTTEYTYDKVKETAIIGGTYYWNQLIKNGNFATRDPLEWGCSGGMNEPLISNNECTFELLFSGDTFSQSISTIIDDIYLAVATVKVSDSFEDRPGTIVTFDGIGDGAALIGSNSKFLTYSFLGKATNQQSAVRFYLNGGADTPPALVTIRNVMVFNLTQLVGKTIANYLATQEEEILGYTYNWFKSIFPNYYYKNNAGELITVNCAQKINTGFNLFDKNTVISDYIIDSSGNLQARQDAAVSAYIPILPGINYYHNWTQVGTWARVVYFDGSKTAIAHTAESSSIAPPTACYARINILADELHTACYKIYSAIDNSKYKSYTSPIIYSYDSSIQLYGIPVLNNNNFYYYGDEYYPNGTVKRKVKHITLNALSPWESGEGNLLVLNLPDMKINGRIWYNSGVTIECLGTQLQVEGALPECEFIYELENEILEQAQSYEEIQMINPEGIEGFLNAGILDGSLDVNIPIGHKSYYQRNTKGNLANLLAPPQKNNSTSVELYCEADLRYQCGVVDSITIHPPTIGITDIIFTTNSTVTLITIDDGVIWPGVTAGQTPTLEPNTIYELNIMDGKYGVMTSWPVPQN